MENNMEYGNRKRWLGLWFRLGVYAYEDVIFAYKDIVERYSEPQRRYHNLSHIDNCLAEFTTVSYLSLDPDTLELAIWYHDAVYEIGADNNEERSAALAQTVMEKLNLPADKIQRVKDIILATKHNAVPEYFDAKLMLDIDIANIGDAAKFKETNKLVREEYFSVPENLFAIGRSNILESFLNRPRIYLTDYFYEKYEMCARENLQLSIKNLRQNF